MRLGFHWNERSSPAVAALTITACWTVALGVAAFVTDLFGLDLLSHRAADLTKVVGGVTLALGLVAILVSLDFRSRRGLRPMRSARPN